MSLRSIPPTLALVTVVACGSGGSSNSSTNGQQNPDGGSPGVTGSTMSPDKAASDAAAAYCNRAQACAPAFVTVGFGDVQTCIARLKQTLLPVFSADGTSSTPDQTEACAQAIPQMSCADLLSRVNPEPCKTQPGALADGAACSADSQCQGTRCKTAPDAICGTCTEPAAAGAACALDADCQEAMTCISGSCVKYGNETDSCDATHLCRPDLACKSGACSTPTAVGDSCASSDECENSQGVYCDPQSNKCAAVGFAGPNGTCGFVNNVLVVCSGPGSLCGSVDSKSYQGTCVPYAADGAKCDAANGPLCNAGAVCVNSVCTIPDPSTCH